MYTYKVPDTLFPTCCSSMVSTWTVLGHPQGFAGSKPRPAANSINSATRLPIAWPGIWNVKDCWKGMPSTALWNWMAQMKTQWINYGVIPLRIASKIQWTLRRYWRTWNKNRRREPHSCCRTVERRRSPACSADSRKYSGSTSVDVAALRRCNRVSIGLEA